MDVSLNKKYLLCDNHKPIHPSNLSAWCIADCINPLLA
jgi:hypothetical protein